MASTANKYRQRQGESKSKSRAPLGSTVAKVSGVGSSKPKITATTKTLRGNTKTTKTPAKTTTTKTAKTPVKAETYRSSLGIDVDNPYAGQTSDEMVYKGTGDPGMDKYLSVDFATLKSKKKQEETEAKNKTAISDVTTKRRAAAARDNARTNQASRTRYRNRMASTGRKTYGSATSDAIGSQSAKVQGFNDLMNRSK